MSKDSTSSTHLTHPLLFLTPLSMSCSCILSHVLHLVPCRPRGTRGAGGRCISSISLSLILFPVTHLTTVRSSSSLVVPCDISGSSNFFVIAYYITMKEFLSKQRDTQGQNCRWHLWFTKHIKHQNLSTTTTETVTV